MADYYHLISEAISAADEKTGKGRRVFYDRARAILVDELRKADPPLSEAIIERERLASCCECSLRKRSFILVFPLGAHTT